MAKWTDGRLVINISRFFQQFASELRRRKVLRVVAVYAVVAWVVLQVAVVVAEPLGFPPWTMRALIIAAIVGFPVSFLLAWVIDIRPEGLIFDLPLFATVDERRAQRKSDLIFAGILILLLAGGAYYLIIELVNETGSLVQARDDIVEKTPVPKNSIAVLAFQNFGGESDSDYFAAGLAEEILHLLASLDELSVASPTSSFQFKGKQIDVREVASRLSVANVLEGSARQQNNLVRAKAYLSNGKTGFSEWVRTFERPIDDIFAVQQEIANSVVRELQLVLSLDSKKELRKQATQSSDAYVHYLNGLGRLRSSLDADVMSDASDAFKLAIDTDPTFSKAYAGICEAHLRLYDIRNTIGDFEIAETACRRASELDPGLNGEINLALGKLYLYRGWYDRAEQQLNKSLTVSSTPVDTYIELGKLRMVQGRLEEAEKFLKQATEIKSNYWSAQEALASFYYRTREYKKAAIAYEKASMMAPDVATVFGGKGATHWMMGSFDEAIAAYEQSLRIKPSRQAYTNIGSLHFNAGRFEEAIANQRAALEFAPNDHRVWGRLAEANHFNKNPIGAKEAYGRAAELAEKNVKVNTSDWKTIALMGTYYAHLEQREKAMEFANRAVKLAKDDPEAYLLKALAHLQLGDDDTALSSLEQSIRLSEQYRQFLVTDPFLQSLRDNPRFQALLPQEGT
ncbi:MAG: tetratricopeptide repeat protein [Pseudomonadota bacterium]